MDCCLQEILYSVCTISLMAFVKASPVMFFPLRHERYIYQTVFSHRRFTGAENDQTWSDPIEAPDSHALPDHSGITEEEDKAGGKGV